MAVISRFHTYTSGWYGGCNCEDMALSDLASQDSDYVGKLIFVQPSPSHGSYRINTVGDSTSKLKCGKFYTLVNNTNKDVDISNFHILSEDGMELSECCDTATPTPPTIISPQSLANIASVIVTENTTLVTTVVATGDLPIAYSMESSDDYDKFNLNSTTGVLSFESPPDFESPTDVGEDNIYKVKVIATNASGTDELTLNVSVTDVDDTIVIPIPPTIILPGGGGSTTAINVPENTTSVSVVVATGDSPITYSFESYGDFDKFDLDSTSGELTFKTPPDFENPTDSAPPANDNMYMIRVIATNTTGSDSIEIHVTVTNVGDGVMDCPVDGNVEDSCLEVTLHATNPTESYQKVAGIYEYNPNDSAYTNVSEDFPVDNSKPHWIKTDGSGVEIFFVYIEDHPSDDYTDMGYWHLMGPDTVIAVSLPVGYGPSAGPPWNMEIPPYPWCRPDMGSGPIHIFGFATIAQVECPLPTTTPTPVVEPTLEPTPTPTPIPIPTPTPTPITIPCCDGFSYEHTQSTDPDELGDAYDEDNLQTGEPYGNVELQKAKGLFSSTYPNWDIATMCHNGAQTPGVMESINIKTLQEVQGTPDYPYKHGEVAFGAQYDGEMRITLVNGQCYRAHVSPGDSDVIFVPQNETLTHNQPTATPPDSCADCIEVTLTNRHSSVPPYEFEGRYEWDGTMQHGAKVYAHTVHGTKTTYSDEDGYPVYSSNRNTYHFWNIAGNTGWASTQHADNLSEPPCITTMWETGNVEVVSCD